MIQWNQLQNSNDILNAYIPINLSWKMNIQKNTVLHIPYQACITLHVHNLFKLLISKSVFILYFLQNNDVSFCPCREMGWGFLKYICIYLTCDKYR